MYNPIESLISCISLIFIHVDPHILLVKTYLWWKLSPHCSGRQHGSQLVGSLLTFASPSTDAGCGHQKTTMAGEIRLTRFRMRVFGQILSQSIHQKNSEVFFRQKKRMGLFWRCRWTRAWAGWRSKCWWCTSLLFPPDQLQEIKNG